MYRVIASLAGILLLYLSVIGRHTVDVNLRDLPPTKLEVFTTPKDKEGEILNLLQFQPPQAVLSICYRHAPKCPLNAENWPGDGDGWQYTGKKWKWYPWTPLSYNRTIVWEWSRPYSGTTPEYYGQREDHYSDFSINPDGFPFESDRLPKTYDWERWIPTETNYRLAQFGKSGEDISFRVGVETCDDGVIYPVVNHEIPFAFTSMKSNMFGKCTGGGYIAASLVEQWGAPMSQKRIELCDDIRRGVPGNYSMAGNRICKISPYAGVVYQRYLFGPKEAGESTILGCEAVVYGWGWGEPTSPRSGQDYEVLFRNGELRFSRWLDLSAQVSGNNLPAYDDHVWWDSRCSHAWWKEGNWLYTGTFQAGFEQYQDTIQLPTTDVFKVPVEGGTFLMSDDSTELVILNNTFKEDTTISIVYSYPPDIAAPDGMQMVKPMNSIIIESEKNRATLSPERPYLIRINYSKENLGLLVENSLGVFTWENNQWNRLDNIRLDVQSQLIEIFLNQAGTWGVFGKPYTVFLPVFPR